MPRRPKVPGTPSSIASSASSRTGSLVLVATVTNESFAENRWKYLKPEGFVPAADEEEDRELHMNRRLLGRTIAHVVDRRDLADAFATWRRVVAAAAEVSSFEALPIPGDDDVPDDDELPDESDLLEPTDVAATYTPEPPSPDEEDDDDDDDDEDDADFGGGLKLKLDDAEDDDDDDDDADDDDESAGSHVDTLAFRLNLDDGDKARDEEEEGEAPEEEPPGDDEWPSEADESVNRAVPPDDDQEEEEVVPPQEEEEEEEQQPRRSSSKLSSFVSSFEGEDARGALNSTPPPRDETPERRSSKLSSFVASFSTTTSAPPTKEEEEDDDEEATPERRREPPESSDASPEVRSSSKLAAFMSSFETQHQPSPSAETPREEPTPAPQEARRSSRVADFVKVFDTPQRGAPPDDDDDRQAEEESPPVVKEDKVRRASAPRDDTTTRTAAALTSSIAGSTSHPPHAAAAADEDDDDSRAVAAARLAAGLATWAARRATLRRGLSVWARATALSTDALLTTQPPVTTVSASSSLDGEKAKQLGGGAPPLGGVTSEEEQELAELSRSLILAFIVRRSESRAKLADERRGWRAWRSLGGGRWYDDEARAAHEALFRAHLVRDRQMRLRVIVATRAQSRRTAALAKAWVRWCQVYYRTSSVSSSSNGPATRGGPAATTTATSWERASSVGSSVGTSERPLTPTALDGASEADDRPQRPPHRLARRNFAPSPQPAPGARHRHRRKHPQQQVARSRLLNGGSPPDSPPGSPSTSVASDSQFHHFPAAGGSTRSRSTPPVADVAVGPSPLLAVFRRLLARRRRATLFVAFHSLRTKLYYAQLARERQRSVSATSRLEAAQFETAELRQLRAIAEEELATCSRRAAEELDAAWRQAKASDDGHVAQSAAFAALEADRRRKDEAVAKEHAAEVEGLKQRLGELESAARNYADMEQMLIDAKMELAMLKSGMA